MSIWASILVSLVGIICIAVAIWFLVHQRGNGSLVVAKKPGLPLTKIAAPDVFDEQRILADLIELSEQPLLFDQYITRVKKRFTTGNQIALLNDWKNLYDSATSTIEAKTKLRRAQSEYTQLETEDEIRRRELDVRYASLNADREEHLLRLDKARRERNEIVNPEPKKSPYDAQMNEAWERIKAEVMWEIRNRQGISLANRQALDLWFNDELSSINRNAGLDPGQRGELIKCLMQLYEDGKEQLKNGARLRHSDESAPEDSIFTK